MATQKNLISLYPQGVLGTLADLRAVDIADTSTNSTVNVLGSGAAGDTYARTYRFDPTSSLTDNGRSVVEPNTSTGAWLEVNPFSGVYLATASVTGFNEDFLAISGNVPLTYTLPPVGAREGKRHTVKQLGTGVITVTGSTANQFIFDQTAGITFTFQGGSGAAKTFLAANGLYFTV